MRRAYNIGTKKENPLNQADFQNRIEGSLRREGIKYAARLDAQTFKFPKVLGYECDNEGGLAIYYFKKPVVSEDEEINFNARLTFIGASDSLGKKIEKILKEFETNILW